MDTEREERRRRFENFVPDPTLLESGVQCGGSMRGVVRWFRAEKGSGRITGDDGYIYWFHHSAIEHHNGRPVEEGERVEFSWHGSRVDFDRKAVEHVRVVRPNQ